MQGLVIEALRPLAGGEVRVVGASRTDAGVHALGQVASVESPRPIRRETAMAALNATLPRDVRVLAARARAGGVQRSPGRPPEALRLPPGHGARALAVPPWARVARRPAARRPGDGGGARSAPREARLLGLLRGAGARAATPSARSARCAWSGAPHRIGVLISADAFLHHMVRNIVGTLVEVGLGRRPAAWAWTSWPAETARRRPDRAAHGLYCSGCGMPRASSRRSPSGDARSSRDGWTPTCHETGCPYALTLAAPLGVAATDHGRLARRRMLAGRHAPLSARRSVLAAA